MMVIKGAETILTLLWYEEQAWQRWVLKVEQV